MANIFDYDTGQSFQDYGQQMRQEYQPAYEKWGQERDRAQQLHGLKQQYYDYLQTKPVPASSDWKDYGRAPGEWQQGRQDLLSQMGDMGYNAPRMGAFEDPGDFSFGGAPTAPEFHYQRNVENPLAAGLKGYHSAYGLPFEKRAAQRTKYDWTSGGANVAPQAYSATNY